MPPQNPAVPGAAGPDEAVPGGNPVSNIPADRAEGVFSLLKLTPHDQPSSMSDLITQHHQTRLANAQMYSNAAKTALHAQLMIQHGVDPDSGMRFDDKDYQGPSLEDQKARYAANYNEAWTNYKKLAGVDQNTKGALAKAEQILNHVLGGGAMQSAPGAPSDQGRPGGMTPPPSAGGAGGPYAGGDAGVVSKGSPLGGGGGQSTTQGMTPPPSPSAQADPNFALSAPMVEANTDFQQNLNRGLEGNKRQYQQGIELRTDQVKRMGMDPQSPTAMRYIATGQFPPVARLQKMLYKDPKTGEVKEGSYDPIQGTILDQQQQVVEGAEPATSGMITPKPFKYMSPDGKSELPGFQVGQQYMDMEGKPLPEGTTLYARGLVPSETLHQQITYGPDGRSQINTLETIHRPLGMPTQGAKSAGPAPKTGGGAAASAPSAGTGGGGRMTPPPVPRPAAPGPAAAAQGAQAVDALGKPLGTSSGAWQNARKAIVPVRGAATQLFGDPTQPELKGYQDYASLSDNTPERKDLANALQLAFNSLEQQEKASGGLRALLGNYAGEPQALVDSQTSVMQDVIGKLSPQNQEAFNAAMAVYGTVMGLRSLTGAGAYQFSVKAMEREVPLPGLNTFSRPQFYDKMSRLAEEVYNGSKNLPMPQSERDYYAGKVKEYRQLATGRKGGTTAAPTVEGSAVAPKTASEYLSKFGIKPAGQP